MKKRYLKKDTSVIFKNDLYCYYLVRECAYGSLSMHTVVSPNKSMLYLNFWQYNIQILYIEFDDVGIEFEFENTRIQE